MASPTRAQVPACGSQPPACAAARLISLSPLNRSMKQWSANRGTRICATCRSVASSSSEPASRWPIRSRRRSRSGSRCVSRRPASVMSSTMPSTSPESERSGTASSLTNKKLPSLRCPANVSSQETPLSTCRVISSTRPGSPSGSRPRPLSGLPTSGDAAKSSRSSLATYSFENTTLPARSATMTPISAWLSTSSAGRLSLQRVMSRSGHRTGLLVTPWTRTRARRPRPADQRIPPRSRLPRRLRGLRRQPPRATPRVRVVSRPASV